MTGVLVSSASKELPEMCLFTYFCDRKGLCIPGLTALTRTVLQEKG